MDHRPPRCARSQSSEKIGALQIMQAWQVAFCTQAWACGQ